MDDATTQELGDADLFEIQTPGGPIVYAVDTAGTIYLNGDIHPRGSPMAMTEALQEGVEWIGINAVQTLYPLPWLRAKAADSDVQRLTIITSLEQFIRGRG